MTVSTTTKECGQQGHGAMGGVRSDKEDLDTQLPTL